MIDAHKGKLEHEATSTPGLVKLMQSTEGRLKGSLALTWPIAVKASAAMKDCLMVVYVFGFSLISIETFIYNQKH